MVPKRSAKVLSGVPLKHSNKPINRPVMCLLEKIHVLDKFLSGIYSATDQEFNANESTIHIK